MDLTKFKQESILQQAAEVARLRIELLEAEKSLSNMLDAFLIKCKPNNRIFLRSWVLQVFKDAPEKCFRAGDIVKLYPNIKVHSVRSIFHRLSKEDGCLDCVQQGLYRWRKGLKVK